MIHGGTIVDATIIDALSSTKNAEGKRAPEMHQTRKGNQWYFGAKLHVGVDAGSGYIHTTVVTAANVADSAVAAAHPEWTTEPTGRSPTASMSGQKP